MYFAEASMWHVALYQVLGVFERVSSGGGAAFTVLYVCAYSAPHIQRQSSEHNPAKGSKNVLKNIKKK
jgi:hypothetical protein